MRWKIVLEGTDEFGSAHRSELTIDKDLECVSAGEIGCSVEDGKTIMAHLRQVVVNQQCEAYVLTSRFCMDCERFRRIKDYGKRKIRTVFGCVEVRNPRIMNCQRCLPHFCDARTVLRDICLTTVLSPAYEMGKHGAALLLKRLSTGAFVQTDVLFDVELQPGDSD